LDQHLDYRAQQAVAHLKDLVGTERLEFIQTRIREQLTADPVLIRYVKQATGRSPEVDKG